MVTYATAVGTAAKVELFFVQNVIARATTSRSMNCSSPSSTARSPSSGATVNAVTDTNSDGIPERAYWSFPETTDCMGMDL